MGCCGARKQRLNVSDAESPASTGSVERIAGWELQNTGPRGAEKYLYPVAVIALGLFILVLAAI
jgi:hypothetical protein